VSPCNPLYWGRSGGYIYIFSQPWLPNSVEVRTNYKIYAVYIGLDDEMDG